MVDNNGFKYPLVDNSICTDCGKCVKTCNSLKSDAGVMPKVYYAFKHADDNVLSRSSSGGAFTLLSDYILEQNGSVYGAVFDENMVVRHKCATDKQGRDKMRGSKYVQSDTTRIFDEVLNDLKQGKNVLFVGTPCQCAGVNYFVPLKYREKLLLCDLLCDGVGSPIIFKDYIALIEEKQSKKIVDFQFRDKTNGWKSKSVKIVFDDGTTIIKNFMDDPYSEMYSNHLISRPSCFECAHIKDNHHSDITIGDFWSIKDVESANSFLSDKGVSCIIANTEKGKKLLSDFQYNNPDSFLLVDKTAVSKRQRSLNGNIVFNGKSIELMKKYKECGIVGILKKYTNYGFFVRLRRRVKKILTRQ